MKKLIFLIFIMYSLLINAGEMTIDRVNYIEIDTNDTGIHEINNLEIEKEENEENEEEISEIDAFLIDNFKKLTATDFYKLEKLNKKEDFIKLMVLIIDDIKEEILETKIKVEDLKNIEELSDENKEFLEDLYVKYKVEDKKIETLLDKMIFPPSSLIIAQASLESGWGSSKVAINANNIFGMRSVTKNSKTAFKIGRNSYYKRYETLYDSTRDYVMTISRHYAYKDLRKSILNNHDSIEIVQHLHNYSEKKGIYSDKLKSIIIYNNLMVHDS